MKEIKINVDSYNSDSINTIQGNNNAEVYKIYVLFNKRRIDLTGKTVKMAYLRTGTVEGDVINLNITNATEGEITLQITNSISKRDGVYSCQLAIYGADGFLEHTATFGLTVEANIFNKIAGEIENSKDLTYIERILEEAKTVSGDLKTNIPVATNLNSSLENNISNARNINITLADTTEKSKVAATDAIEKKGQLEKSITKAKEFIDGLDGSQNIPQIRLDVDALQNGLKGNQALAYTGSYISANDTLEGRTEGMRIGGKTMYKKADGTYTDTWEEGVTLESFGEKEGNKISILSSGKNLWDGTFTIGSLDTITGVESNAGENRKRSNFISIEKLNTDKITITQYDAIDPIYVHVYDENKNIIGNVYTGNLNFYPINAKLSVTLPSNAKFLRFRTENNRDLKPTSIQIEEGTQSTSYQEYISNKKDILIKSPLREWDSMYEDNGQVKVDRYTSVIDFSNLIINVSEVSERPNAQSTNWFQTNFIPQLKNAKKNTLNFNNKYVGVDAGTAWKDTNDFECLSVAVQEGGVRIQGRVKKGTTIEQLNEKLRGLIIYYQLATPTVDIVENCVDIDLDTFGEKTYFNILNSLPGTLDFKVPSNIGSVVQNMAKEVNNIWDVINNLLVPSIVKANGNLAMIKLNNNLK